MQCGVARYRIHSEPGSLQRQSCGCILYARNTFVWNSKPGCCRFICLFLTRIVDIEESVNSIHTFTVEGIADQQIDFSGFAGKKIIIVNVASRCGFTSQYAQLQELYETYHDQLVIVGFPANDFGGQEPGTNQEIQSFCTTTYGVTFPMAAKIQVTGSQQHPVFSWLTQKNRNGQRDSTVNWNFNKFLLDEQGQLVNSLPSSVSPFDDQILDWLNAS